MDGSDLGDVEAGVYATLTDYGIHEPRTAVEKLAIRLGSAIDNVKYAKDLPPLAAQLRETIEKVKEQPHARPKGESDAVSTLIDRQLVMPLPWTGPCQKERLCQKGIRSNRIGRAITPVSKGYYVA